MADGENSILFNKSFWKKVQRAYVHRGEVSESASERNNNPTETEFGIGWQGTAGRTGYDKIVRAVMSTAADMRENANEQSR